MGLLLSILVSCVGVIELIAFYSDLRRNLRVVNPNESDLEGITCNYRRMLTKEYRLIFAEVNGKDVQRKTNTNFALSTSPKTIFSSDESGNIFSYISGTQTSKTNSILNEDVTNHDLTSQQSKLSSNKLEENKNETCEIPSRNFPLANDKLTFVSQLDAQEINHACYLQESESVPPLLDENRFELMESPNGDSETIIHEIHHIIFHEESESMPTSFYEGLSYHPPYFVDESGIIIDNIHSQQAQDDGISQENVYFLEEEFTPGLIIDETDTNNYDLVVIELDGSSQDIERLYLQEDTVELFRRSPSPFPTYERIAPRGSISSELLDDPISVHEIEESEFNLESNQHQYENTANEMFQLVETTHKSRSLSPTTNIEYQKSLSPVEFSQLQEQSESCQRSETSANHLAAGNLLSQEKNGKYIPDLSIEDQPLQVVYEDNDEKVPQRFVAVEEVFNEDFKNSLDGVKTKNSNENRKQEFKRKRKNRTPSKEYHRSISDETHQSTVLEDSSVKVEVFPNKEELPSSSTLSDQIQHSSLEPEIYQMNEPTKPATEDTDIAITSPDPGPSKEGKKPQAFWVN